MDDESGGVTDIFYLQIKSNPQALKYRVKADLFF